MKKPEKIVYIATPTYDGKVHTQYLVGIVESMLNLVGQGIGVQLVPNLSTTLLVFGRNTLVEEFIKSEATHLMFIDSDLGFSNDAISELLKAEKDFIGGVYPSRKNTTFIFNPKYAENGSLLTDPSAPHLIQADMIPSGFMLITREAILKMREKFAHLSYKSRLDGPSGDGMLLFNTEVIDGEFWSEDYVFCKRAREAGIDIWIDPRLNFNHAGIIGGLHEVLTNTKPE